MKRKSIIPVLLALSMFLTGCFAGKTELLLPHEHVLSEDSDTVNRLTNGKAEWVGNEICMPADDSEYTDENVQAVSAIAFALDGKDVYYSKRPFRSMNPASLTTLFTAAVVLQKRNLDELVTIKAEDVKGLSNASNVNLKAGDQLTVEQLLYGMLLCSGIDAANALARDTAGSVSEFVTLMNASAAEFGCMDSHFENPGGLTKKNHYTTAYDIYMIYHHLATDPRFVKIINSSKYEGSYKDVSGKEVSASYQSTIKYAQEGISTIGSFHVVGGKTGTTAAAGNCLALHVKDQANKDYLVLVLKAVSKDSLYEQIEYIVEKIKN